MVSSNSKNFRRVLRYLKANKIPHKILDGSENILLLVSRAGHHYMLVQFESLSTELRTAFKPFDVQYAYDTNYKTLIKSIERYVRS